MYFFFHRRARGNTWRSYTPAGAKGLIAALREWISRFGSPKEISTDGGPEFVTKETQAFLAKWGIKHCKSSAYFPQSNSRAEAAVKTAKRALMDNVETNGGLNTDNVVRALLAIHNTPYPECKKSPAEIIFNRKLRGLVPLSPFGKKGSFGNKEVDPLWKEAWELKERALRQRAVKSMERLSEHSKHLKELQPGDHVYVQNQTGRNPTKWEKSGKVMERGDNDQYMVKVDGSGRVTARNRRFLCKFDPALIDSAPAQVPFPMEEAVTPTQEPQQDQKTDHRSGPGIMHRDGPEQEQPVEPLQTAPRALRRLADFNNRGLAEDPLMPRRRGNEGQ